MELFKNCKISVILPAGGTGERLGMFPPKQFSLIDGKPLLCYTIDAFEKITWIDRIVVVVAEKHEKDTKIIIDKYNYRKVNIVLGGCTRFRSIAAGVKHLKDNAPDIVVIHDAVRPLVPIEILKDVLIAANEYKAAGPICPLTSTVLLKDENNFLKHSLDRQKYFASEMPQSFAFNVIHDAFTKCDEYDFDNGTECLHLVDKYCDVKAKLVSGSPELWKVTYLKDLYAAEKILRKKSNPVLLEAGTMCNELKNKITKKLESNINIHHIKDHFIPENLKDLNRITFHSEFQELMNSCKGFTSQTNLPRIMIHVILNNTLNVEFMDMAQVVKNIAQNICKSVFLYVIWKIRSDWSEENVNQMTDIIVQLLLGKSTHFSGQIFTVC